MRTSITAALFLAAVSAVAETAYYRIELSPSGSLVAVQAPVVRGKTMLVHAYPDGKLMSLRTSDVRKVSPITAQEAAAPAQKSVVAIGNLAMQGGGAQASGSPARPSTARPSAQGPSVIATRDGLAITTTAPGAQGPSVFATRDGLAVTTQAPK